MNKSKLSSCASPPTIGTCETPHAVNSMTPLSVDSSSAMSDDISNVQETPLSICSGRKRKRQKRRLCRSKVRQSLSGERLYGRSSRDADVTNIDGSSDDLTIKREPKMPKLLPEPRVQYNPETPLRISIHLPLSGLNTPAEDRLVNKNVERSEAMHYSDESREVCSANLAMPVDLTSRASVYVPRPTSSSSVADVNRQSCVSLSVSASRPVYSPISSMSGQSTPCDENGDVGKPAQEMPQPSVGIIESFLNRFNGTAAESLHFSPSQSFWTRSFAEQLAVLNQNSFTAGFNLPAPVLSPVHPTVQHVNSQKSVNNSFGLASHSNLVPLSSSVVNSTIRRNSEARDCVTVQPTLAASSQLNIVCTVDHSNPSQSIVHKVNAEVPVLSHGECQTSLEAVSVNNSVLPG